LKFKKLEKIRKYNQFFLKKFWNLIYKIQKKQIFKSKKKVRFYKKKFGKFFYLILKNLHTDLEKIQIFYSTIFLKYWGKNHFSMMMAKPSKFVSRFLIH